MNLGTKVQSLPSSNAERSRKGNILIQYRMPKLNQDKLRELLEDVLAWAEKIEEMETLAETCVGDTKSAYAIVHKDFLWKIQRKIGQLWFYINGIDEMSPFESSTSHEQPASEHLQTASPLPSLVNSSSAPLPNDPSQSHHSPFP